MRIMRIAKQNEHPKLYEHYKPCVTHAQRATEGISVTELV